MDKDFNKASEEFNKLQDEVRQEDIKITGRIDGDKIVQEGPKKVSVNITLDELQAQGEIDASFLDEADEF